jgi:hypothetical protein
VPAVSLMLTFDVSFVNIIIALFACCVKMLTPDWYPFFSGVLPHQHQENVPRRVSICNAGYYLNADSSIQPYTHYHCAFCSTEGAVMKRLIVALVLLCVLIPSPIHVYAEDEPGAVSNPIPIGSKLIIKEGGTYEYSITIKAVYRGDQAWRRLKAANQFNKPPEVGIEFLLVHAAVTYIKGPPFSELVIMMTDFTTYSQDKFIDIPAGEVPPEPRIIFSELKPSKTVDGWLALQIYKGEKYPVVVFGDTFHMGDLFYFAAYPRKAAAKSYKRQITASSHIYPNGYVNSDSRSAAQSGIENIDGLDVPPDVSDETSGLILLECGAPRTDDPAFNAWADKMATAIYLSWTLHIRLNKRASR